MKTGIHPNYNAVCFVDIASGKKYLTRSTINTKQKEVIDGIEYGVIICDITMDTHPVYTGKKRFVDTAGRVERFQRRFNNNHDK